MSRVKREIIRSFIGAVAVAALALAALGGAGPAAHADGGVYPPLVYGPAGTCCFHLVGPWFDGGGVGLAGHELYTFSNGPDAQVSFAGWNAGGLDPYRNYDVCAYIPNDNANAQAQYHVSGRDGDSGPLVVDQSQYSNQWAFVGSAFPTSAGHIIVHVSDRSEDPAGSTVIGADAMLVIPEMSESHGTVAPDDAVDVTCLPHLQPPTG
jgi:hypothetical protein